jgi:hypothetical protein
LPEDRKKDNFQNFVLIKHTTARPTSAVLHLMVEREKGSARLPPLPPEDENRSSCRNVVSIIFSGPENGKVQKPIDFQVLLHLNVTLIRSEFREFSSFVTRKLYWSFIISYSSIRSYALPNEASRLF